MGPTVRLDESDHEIRPASDPPMALLEHPVGLADTGRHAHVHAQPAAAVARLRPDAGEHLLARGADVERVSVAVGHGSVSGPTGRRGRD